MRQKGTIKRTAAWLVDVEEVTLTGGVKDNPNCPTRVSREEAVAWLKQLGAKTWERIWTEYIDGCSVVVEEWRVKYPAVQTATANYPAGERAFRIRKTTNEVETRKERKK